MNFLHYTNRRLTRVLNAPQDKGIVHRFAKPAGLWLTIDDAEDYGWPQWCRDNDFFLGIRRYVVTLCEPHGLLHLKNSAELTAFTADYGDDNGGVNWGFVAQDYPGILITPYVWACRLQFETSWYYGWDCASACVWDARVVRGLLEDNPRPGYSLAHRHKLLRDERLRQRRQWEGFRARSEQEVKRLCATSTS